MPVPHFDQRVRLSQGGGRHRPGQSDQRIELHVHGQGTPGHSGPGYLPERLECQTHPVFRLRAEGQRGERTDESRQHPPEQRVALSTLSLRTAERYQDTDPSVATVGPDQLRGDRAGAAQGQSEEPGAVSRPTTDQSQPTVPVSAADRTADIRAGTTKLP